MDMNEKLGRIEREVYLSLSDDEEAKRAGESKQMKVKFILDAGWTVNDLVDRLLTITTSPRVAFQNANRGKTYIPSEYIVPKVGMRAAAPHLTPFEHLCEVFGKEKMLKLVNEAGGNIDAVVEKFTALAKEMGLE